MLNPDIYLKFFFQMSGHLFSTINRAMPSTCTTKIYHQMFKIPLDIFLKRLVNYAEAVIQKQMHFRLFFKESNNFRVFACFSFVFFVATRIVYGTAIKYKTTAMAVKIYRNAPFV